MRVAKKDSSRERFELVEYAVGRSERVVTLKIRIALVVYG
jgi:hypothetical protein